MSFKSFAGIILAGIIGLAVASDSQEKSARAQTLKSDIPVETYNFVEPIYITPSAGSDASLDH